MKRSGSRGYYLLAALLVAILVCSGCKFFQKNPTTAALPHNCNKSTGVCVVKINGCKANPYPSPDPAKAPLGYELIWHPEGGHTYSIHFKARTPISVNVLPAEKFSAPVTGDSQCNNPTTNSDPNCDFPYYLTQDDTNTQCGDPVVHVVPQ
jgi:hypothetical protein